MSLLVLQLKAPVRTGQAMTRVLNSSGNKNVKFTVWCSLLVTPPLVWPVAVRLSRALSRPTCTAGFEAWYKYLTSELSTISNFTSVPGPVEPRVSGGGHGDWRSVSRECRCICSEQIKIKMSKTDIFVVLSRCGSRNTETRPRADWRTPDSLLDAEPVSSTAYAC